MKSYQNPQPQAVKRADQKVNEKTRTNPQKGIFKSPDDSETVKKKENEDSELDDDLEDTFPASDAITKY